MTKFLQAIKAQADELALLGAPLEAEDLMEKILDGLGDDYKELARAVQARGTSISFEELHEKLLDFEASFLPNKLEPSYFPTSTNPTSGNTTAWRPSNPSVNNTPWQPSNNNNNRSSSSNNGASMSNVGNRPSRPYLGYCQICKIQGHMHSPQQSTKLIVCQPLPFIFPFHMKIFLRPPLTTANSKYLVVSVTHGLNHIHLIN